MTRTSGACRTALRSAVGKSGASEPDFNLLDHAAIVLMLELDWVFDRDDMPRIAPIDLGNECRHRGRLAGPGRAADQHEAAPQRRQGVDSLAAVPTRTGVAPSRRQTRMAAAARPRSRCRLTLKRPRPWKRIEASEIPDS